MAVLGRMVRALVTLAALGWPAMASAEWRRAESANFVVYSEGSEASLRAQIILLEDFDRLLRQVTNIRTAPAPNKLHVYVVRTPGQLRTANPTLPPNAGGFYTAAPGGVAAFVNERADGQLNEILFHEYVHHFMYQYTATAYPAWYSEGFAEYFMTARFTPDRIEYGNFSQMRAPWVVGPEWLPMERVLFGRSDGLREDDVSRFYAQSWLLTHYFFSQPDRIARLNAYLAAISRGDAPEAAFVRETGFAPEAMAAELHRYIARRRIRYNIMRRSSAATPPPVAVTSLPRSADGLLLLEAGLRTREGGGSTAALLAAVRREAARFPGDAFARRVLAHAEVTIGDPSAADALLDPLLAANPRDGELLYLKGLRHLNVPGGDEAAQAREALRWFGRAHRADEHHFPTLLAYARAMRFNPDYVSENSGNVLLLAAQLAPQVAQARAMAASMMMNLRRYDDVIRLMAPLAADPHDAQVAEQARRIVEEARRLAAAQRPAGSTPASH